LKDTQLENFNGFGLAAPLVAALAKIGYAKPTPIQAQAIPVLMNGRDLVGVAFFINDEAAIASGVLSALEQLVQRVRAVDQYFRMAFE
jgi:ATP-dependent RNA helicase RhlE